MKINKKMLMLIPTLALASVMYAQPAKTTTGSSTTTKTMTPATEQQKKADAKKAAETEAAAAAAKEEKVVWNYAVVDVYGTPGDYQIVFGKPSGSVSPEAKKTYMQGERIQSASSTYKSESDILQMFTTLDMELVTVLIENTEKGTKKSYYLRSKSTTVAQ